MVNYILLINKIMLIGLLEYGENVEKIILCYIESFKLPTDA